MKILFISSGSIGDAIISTGLIGWLADRYPEARFTIAAGPAPAALFEAFDLLERLIVIRKRPWNGHWLTLWAAVRGTRWDLAVDLRGSALTWLIGAKKRVIFHSPDRSLSKAEQLAKLFDLPSPPPPRLWASAAAKAQAGTLLGSRTHLIVIAPKTNSTAKDWPIERFAALAQRIRHDQMTFVILATTEQQASIQPLVNALPPAQVLDLSGKTDLLTAYAILERATLFIGNDSGLLHMAAAAGISCIGIYGPSNDKTYAPRGPHVRIITAYDFKPGEAEKRDPRYMEMISVERVEEAAKRFL